MEVLIVTLGIVICCALLITPPLYKEFAAHKEKMRGDEVEFFRNALSELREKYEKDVKETLQKIDKNFETDCKTMVDIYSDCRKELDYFTESVKKFEKKFHIDLVELEKDDEKDG